MRRLLWTGMKILPAAVVLVPVFWILYGTVYRRNWRKSVLHCLFFLYLSAVFTLVGIPDVTYIRFDLNLNLIPLWGMAEDFKNSILNILLFVPLGFFLPLLWERFGKKRAVVLFGFSMSLFIEILQIFTYRATDVNDLITNTCGAIVGFMVAEYAMRKHPAIMDGVDRSRTGELYALWAMAFLVMFFVHPFLSVLIWNRIL